MKKFISGIIVGIGISACTVTFASESLQAFLFPSKVTFHNKGETKEVSFSNDDPVINYNNKAYIPLRLFSETLNGKVIYTAPSESSGGKNVIDIYLNDDDKNVILRDTENIVSISNLESNPSGNNSYSLSGLITINKDLEGKVIEIHALDSNKKVTGSSAEITIDGVTAVNTGDKRKFSTFIFSKETPSSFEVLVRDSWGLTTLEYFMDGMINSVAGISFGPPSIDENKKALIPALQFKNQGKEDINIEPLSIEFQINKVIGERKEIIKSYKLSDLKGEIPAMSWYQAYLPIWDLKDQNAVPVLPGKYEVSIIVPNSLKYNIEGSVTTETLNDFARYKKWDVEITQDQINKITNK
ncbi:hypothetical protein QFZ77_007584 [Paenibacillus sp. V4I3]|uniref:hypothetical protein n=1 Tax=Paenibacillus sp. V4I3 TaxID=3042305 RepID=UPI002783CDDB|nr:hypothetical protein [Paenibacillus sp. V4I3]MDQ0878925.1 hypothetical protein [Paenibacillus sp. V4I3]